MVGRWDGGRFGVVRWDGVADPATFAIAGATTAAVASSYTATTPAASAIAFAGATTSASAASFIAEDAGGVAIDLAADTTSALAGSFAATAPATATFTWAATADLTTVASGYLAVATTPGDFSFSTTTTATLAGTFAATAPPSSGFTLAQATAAAVAAVAATHAAPAGTALGFAATTSDALASTWDAAAPVPSVASFAATTSDALASTWDAAAPVPSVVSFAASAPATLASDLNSKWDTALAFDAATTSVFHTEHRVGSVAADELKPAIVATIKASAWITELIGPRIYPDVIPQTVVKGATAVAYWFVSAERENYMNDPSGWVLTRVRFRLQSSRLSEIEELKRRIRHRFQGHPGNLGAVRVAFVTFENESDGYDEPIAGSDLGTHWKQLDLRFKHYESLPIHV